MSFKEGVGSKQWVIGGVVIVISMVLVIGRHFDTSWAGGEGYRARVPIVVVEQTEPSTDLGCEAVDATRQNILSCSSMTKVTFGGSAIWLDRKTALVVINDREGKEELALYGGRIVVNGPVVIDVRDLQFTESEPRSFVNYSWLYRVDVLLMNQKIAKSFDTLPPYDQAKDITFSTQSEAVKDFYDWAH